MSDIARFELQNGGSVRFKLHHKNILRVSIAPKGGDFKDSALNKFGFINESLGGAGKTASKKDKAGFSLSAGAFSVKGDLKTGAMTFHDAKGAELASLASVSFEEKQAKAVFNAKKGEDWVGFGDLTRERLYHRGHVADCLVTNVKSYIPVPFFMSTCGYAIMDNTVHRAIFDMCKTDKNKYSWRNFDGAMDFYVFIGESFKELLHLYTELTGKPKLPPFWSFGLWYICRTQANDYEAVNDALNFRREKIPCDVIGLEPGWMEKDYDLSTDKKWNEKLFPIPSWAANGPHTFISALKRMGFKLELWLCNEYDLLYEEERRLGRQSKAAGKTEKTGNFHEDGEQDQHFAYPRFLDTITKKDEAWFEHLKKFVDNGADFFKQDGAYQVSLHADRVWGPNALRDEEVHNIYPLFYSRQMHEGFQEHANRRPLVFTPCGWAGFQAWCGTWTGDTGGRLVTLGAMLNTSLVGHSWSTNDMEVMQKEGVHFGYLQPWSQINSWTYFRMPWIQGDEICELHRYYSQLRSRLFPYLYSWAYQATKTAVPLLLPLTVEFQDDAKCRDILHQYLLGRDLLVVIYKDEARFPAGMWKDFWTGELVKGPCDKKISWPSDRGGGLYIREGAIIPFGPLMQYRGEKPMDEISLYVFPSEKPSEFELYEDDGVTLDHNKGKFSITKITAKKTKDTVSIDVGGAKGSFPEMVANRSWSLTIAAASKPAKVLFNKKDVTARAKWDKTRNELVVEGLR